MLFFLYRISLCWRILPYSFVKFLFWLLFQMWIAGARSFKVYSESTVVTGNSRIRYKLSITIWCYHILNYYYLQLFFLDFVQKEIYAGYQSIDYDWSKCSEGTNGVGKILQFVELMLFFLQLWCFFFLELWRGFRKVQRSKKTWMKTQVRFLTIFVL